jgi:hypothetical protein
MAHYAIIENTNNTVIEVRTGVDETVTQTDFDGTQVGGSTEKWEAFYGERLKNNNLYVKRTSYNGNIRKQYAGIGYTYDPDADEFVAPQPFPSWTLDENNDWQPPILHPNDGQQYRWSEENLEWVAV